VHFEWLAACTAERTIVLYAKYIVPAGKDITGEEIDQKMKIHRSIDDPYTPLNGVIVCFVYFN